MTPAATAALEAFLVARAESGQVAWPVYEEAARRFSLSFHTIEMVVLSRGLFPLRYQRQQELLGAAGQLRLLQTRAALVGCGGLGGAIFEMLVRLGIGHIVVIDPDRFTESNLNRQLLASLENLGHLKVEAAGERARQLNPVVEVVPLAERFQSLSAASHLAGCELVFDGLDSVADRLELSQFCRREGLYMVHGAVSGWYGQGALLSPDAGELERFYPGAAVMSESISEGNDSANLVMTVNAIAALQVAGALRFLLQDSKESLPGGFFLDLSGPELEAWS